MNSRPACDSPGFSGRAGIVEDPPVRTAPIIALLATTLACAGSSKGAGAGADPCADFEVEVERYWSASIRAEVLERGGELKVERRTGAVNQMGRISEDW